MTELLIPVTAVVHFKGPEDPEIRLHGIAEGRFQAAVQLWLNDLGAGLIPGSKELPKLDNQPLIPQANPGAVGVWMVTFASKPPVSFRSNVPLAAVGWFCVRYLKGELKPLPELVQ